MSGINACRKYRAFLVEDAMSPLSPDDSRGLSRHVASCERCRTESLALGRLSVLVADARPPRSPRPGFEARFRAALAEEKALEEDRESVRPRSWIEGLIGPGLLPVTAAGAAMAVLVFSASLVSNSTWNDPSPGIPATVASDEASAPAEAPVVADSKDVDDPSMVAAPQMDPELLLNYEILRDFDEISEDGKAAPSDASLSGPAG